MQPNNKKQDKACFSYDDANITFSQSFFYFYYYFINRMILYYHLHVKENRRNGPNNP